MPVSDEHDQTGIIFSLLSFVAQCSLIELKEKGVLEKFLQEIKALLAIQNHQLHVGNICHVAIAKDHDPDLLSIINHIDPFPKGDDSHLAIQNAADAATA
jgi:hypothetical protein